MGQKHPPPGMMPQGTNIKVDIKDGKPLRCPKCKKDLFEPCQKLLYFSPLVGGNPTGREIVVPSPQEWRCISCKRVIKNTEGLE